MKKKKYSVIDDDTLDNMKRYYKLENYEEILQYLRRNNVLAAKTSFPFFYAESVAISVIPSRSAQKT